MSAVPGRTDRHTIRVPSGSYVLPSQHIAHQGQDNTLAGFSAIGKMFGPSGPYSAVPIAKMRQGPGGPRPPRMITYGSAFHDSGGARGEGDHDFVPVIVAGGEHILHPDNVVAVALAGTKHPEALMAKYGYQRLLKHGHKILDSWVMSDRKDHIKTHKNLAPPVKG